MDRTFAYYLADAQSRIVMPDYGFTVADVVNWSGENLGALAILGAAAEQGYCVGEMLLMFGGYWDDVRKNPNGNDHPNIRALAACDSSRFVKDVVKFKRPGVTPAMIDTLWEMRNDLTPGQSSEPVDDVLDALDAGRARVAHKVDDDWQVNEWLKKAILLSFRLNDNEIMPGPGDANWWDKVPSKFANWDAKRFQKAGFRAVPGSIVRHGAHIGHNVVLMPSFVNIGASVGEGTMVDTWATVGSCAQIGKNVHLSGGVGIGGVLEPLQANPVIIEDDCFIGARSEVVEGVIVGKGAVLAMGVFLSSTTKIVDRQTGDVHMGYVPPYSVVVPGTLPGKPLPDGSPGPNLACAVIVKTVDAKTRSKTAINELLRD